MEFGPVRLCSTFRVGQMSAHFLDPTRWTLQGGSVVNSVLSIDERNLRSLSINDLVHILTGASGLSRLRIRPQQGGAGTIFDACLSNERAHLNFSL